MVDRRDQRDQLRAVSNHPAAYQSHLDSPCPDVGKASQPVVSIDEFDGHPDTLTEPSGKLPGPVAIARAE